jgi:hypothetical protein
MKRVAWTKFQDFYLRLGFLKALAAVLSVERRSVPNDGIIHRLQSPLFDPAPKHPMLWTKVEQFFPEVQSIKNRAALNKKEKEKEQQSPSVAEALLVRGDCPSTLFAITGPTSYKVLDWGRNVELIGRGNQITERGLLLRFLLHERETSAFFSGDVSGWNPFSLNLKEKLFFLYHLAEIDGVIVELLLRLGDPDRDGPTELESADAARLTCAALLDVLKREQHKVPPAEVLRFRIASALAATIAEELDMLDEVHDLMGATRRKLPKIIKPRARRAKALGGGRRSRKTTKNADHQTIPRFEQLVDLGFLSKPLVESDDEIERIAARKRWVYSPTDVCLRWAAAVRELQRGDSPFLWHSFAAAALRAFQIQPSVSVHANRANLTARYVWQAYEHIHRRVGANPLDSVALFAMLSAAVDGIPLEMSEIHNFMLTIRQKSLLPQHAFFSSGNELDQMFIQLKPGFLEQVESLPGEQAVFRFAGVADENSRLAPINKARP